MASDKKQISRDVSRFLYNLFSISGCIFLIIGTAAAGPFIVIFAGRHRNGRHHNSYAYEVSEELFEDHFLWVFIIGLICLLIGAVLTSISGRFKLKPISIYSDEMTELKTKADKAHAAGDTDSEISALTQLAAMENAPSDVSVRLGGLYEGREQRETALEIYKNVIENDADCSGALVGATRCLNFLGKYDEALAYAEKSAAFTSPKSPDFIEAMVHYAIAAGKTGDEDTFSFALEEAEKAGYTDGENLRKTVYGE